MSLLLDALKKSEAQRRRGTSPTIDLTRAPPSGNPRRPGSRWLPVLLIVVLLAAAAPWLWPKVSDWMEQRRGDPGDSAALAEADGATPPGGGSETVAAPSAGDEAGAAVSAPQAAPAPVAGASSPRRVAAEATPADGEGQNAARPGADSRETPGNAAGASDPVASSADDGDGPDGPDDATAETSDPTAAPSTEEMRRMVQARQQQPQVDEQKAPEPRAQPAGPANNFIRPWELPQAQRAEFPQLSLTVHFYAEQAADRFVLINGERYREGQRVGPGTTLAEIRQRGAVVEFGSYRVLIE